jgi:hypothetical protein
MSLSEPDERPTIEWTPARLGLVAVAIVAIIYALISIRFTLVPTGERVSNAAGGVLGNDFMIFYSSSKIVLEGEPANVFDQDVFFALQDSISGKSLHFPFGYPPHVLLLLAPLALVPYIAALYGWLAFVAVPFVALARRMSGTPWLALLVMPPIVQNMISGQNGAFTAALIAGGVAAIATGRSFLAGLLFGCLAYKPQVLVLAPICLLACRDWRAFQGLVVTGLGLPLLGLAVFGFDIWRQFVEHLPEHMAYVTSGRLPRDRFATTFISLLELTGSENVARAGQAVSTLCAWGLVYWSWRKTSDVFARVLAFAVAMPLATPYIYDYDLALWALPAAFLGMRLWRGQVGGAWWLAFLLLTFLPSLIWIVSTTKHNVTVLPVLALAPFVIAAVRQTAGPRPIAAPL